MTLNLELCFEWFKLIQLSLALKNPGKLLILLHYLYPQNTQNNPVTKSGSKYHIEKLSFLYISAKLFILFWKKQIFKESFSEFAHLCLNKRRKTTISPRDRTGKFVSIPRLRQIDTAKNSVRSCNSLLDFWRPKL